MKIQLRHDTAAAWVAANPVLADAELGVEDDTGRFKIGDGVTAWIDLAYPVGGSGMTMTDGDARYVQQSQINAAGGVAGLDAGAFVGETNLPLPPVDLTILLENKLA